MSGTPAEARTGAELRAVLEQREEEIERLRSELTTARRRYEAELAVARQIQLSLMPVVGPAVPGCDIAMAYRPAQLVGGDFYDVYALARAGPRDEASQVLGLAVGDVTGKGVTAALMMAFVRAVMRSAAYNGTGPADTLARTNRVLRTDVRTGLFLTAFTAELDGASGRLRYASAGHEPPLIVHRSSGKVAALRAGGMMLGLADDPRIVEHDVRLAPGDVVIVYTDGVTDARDRWERFFGERRLRHLLRANAARGARDAGSANTGARAGSTLGALLVEAILERVTAFAGDRPAADDITIVALGRSPDRPAANTDS